MWQSQNILTLQNTDKGAVHKGRHHFRGEVSCLLTVDDITGAGVQLVQCDKTRPGNYCVSKCGKRVGRYKLVIDNDLLNGFIELLTWGESCQKSVKIMDDPKVEAIIL